MNGRLHRTRFRQSQRRPRLFSLAHLSDIHLGPLPGKWAWRDFALKRQIGYLSWRLNRHRLHIPEIANAIADDIVEARVDHVALTGDMVNIAAGDEFPIAARWMAELGSPDRVSFVPGNHDTYVVQGWEEGLSHLGPYMTGDMKVASVHVTPQVAASFPYVRLRKNIAFIGLCSGLPQPLHRAAGFLGEVQLQSLRFLLRDLRERGFARVVMIHHPPLPGLAPPRKALKDAEALRDVLAAEGAELVLHGHNHRHMENALQSRFGMVHALGVPSASMALHPEYDRATWNRYDIERTAGRWVTAVTVRSWNADKRQVETVRQFTLST